MITDLHQCVSDNPAKCRCGDCLTQLAGDPRPCIWPNGHRFDEDGFCVCGVGYEEDSPGRDVNFAAVRAFDRVWTPISWELAYAEDCDRGFDAGEWSSPAHARIYDDEYEKALGRVAVRFGLTADELGRMVDVAWNINSDRFYASMVRKAALRRRT